MNVKPTFFWLLAVACCVQAGYAQDRDNPALTRKVLVETDSALHTIRPEFWGTNLLYWLDDDKALSDGKIASGIKEAGIRLLRYPGGTVADNFHWKSNTLENTHMFPYESGDAETDFDEFMRLCRATGAEPMCVLNTESWAAKNDIPGGAHEAAEWLRYCLRKGYRVKYWEIGNETYWHPVMSAREYARLVNVYADSLKKVDPDIILGINGHWNLKMVGTRERVRKEALEELMTYRANISNRESYRRYKRFLEDNTILPVTTGSEKWWQTLAEHCGQHAGMLIVHWYFSPRQLPFVSKRLTEVRELFEQKYPGKKFLLNMSEYNVTERTPGSFLHLTEMIGAMLKAKTDIAAIWPLRMDYKKPVLLDVETGEPSIFFQVHRQLSGQLTGQLVQASSAADVPAYASASDSSATVVLTGSQIDQASPVTIQLKGSGRKFQSCRVWRIQGSEFEYRHREDKLTVEQQSVTIDLQPSEVLIAVFH